MDYFLASALFTRNEFAKARALLAECLENAERLLERHPQDLSARRYRFQAYCVLSGVADVEGKDQEFLENSERTIALGESCVRLAFESDLIDKLAVTRSFACTMPHSARRSRESLWPHQGQPSDVGRAVDRSS